MNALTDITNKELSEAMQYFTKLGLTWYYDMETETYSIDNPLGKNILYDLKNTRELHTSAIGLWEGYILGRSESQE